VTAKRGLSEAVDSIYVEHVGGGTSVVTLKTYQEGRESFQGVGVNVVWLDFRPLEHTDCSLTRTKHACRGCWWTGII
jgi:hypothetical protein